MPKRPRPKKTANRQPRAVSYVVDMEAGEHRYVFVEGVGEYRAHFQKLVEDLERGVADVVVVAKASLLYVDTSPMWTEKFIATVKRRGVLIADARTQKEYDLRKREDETAFRALKQESHAGFSTPWPHARCFLL